MFDTLDKFLIISFCSLVILALCIGLLIKDSLDD